MIIQELLKPIREAASQTDIIIWLILAVSQAVILVIFIIRFKKTAHFLKYGLFFGNGAFLLLIPNIYYEFSISPNLPPPAYFRDQILLLLQSVFIVSMGVYFCQGMNTAGAPLAERILKRRWLISWSTLWPPIVIAGSLIIFNFVFSILLLKYTGARPSPSIEYIRNTDWLNQSADPSFLVFISAIVISSFQEELLFRLGIQTLTASLMGLRGRTYWLAIISTSLIFSLAHANVMHPDWVKYLQIFPLSLSLGYLLKKYGFECCIITHAIFNALTIGIYTFMGQ